MFASGFALLLIVAATPAAAQDFPKLTGRVVDAADLLGPAQEAALTNKLAALEADTTDQLVVVTVPSLGGRTVETYGRMLGNYWGVGQKGSDNGVLLLVASADHRVRIEVGTGLKCVLTNQRAAAIVRDTLVPHFRAGAMQPGIIAGADAIVAILTTTPERARRNTEKASC